MLLKSTTPPTTCEVVYCGVLLKNRNFQVEKRRSAETQAQNSVNQVSVERTFLSIQHAESSFVSQLVAAVSGHSEAFADAI